MSMDSGSTRIPDQTVGATANATLPTTPFLYGAFSTHSARGHSEYANQYQCRVANLISNLGLPTQKKPDLHIHALSDITCIYCRTCCGHTSILEYSCSTRTCTRVHVYRYFKLQEPHAGRCSRRPLPICQYCNTCNLLQPSSIICYRYPDNNRMLLNTGTGVPYCDPGIPGAGIDNTMQYMAILPYLLEYNR